jgi:exopolysaccharide biosynthesis polyprenyl glycosylphosphotransferase
VLWVGLLYVHGAYRMRAHWTIYGEVAPVIRATFWLAVLGFAALFLAAADVQGSGWALILFPLQGLLAIVLRVAVRLVFMVARQRGHNVRNIIVLGTGPEATAFTHLVDDHSVLGVQVIGYLGDRPPAADRGARFFGAYENLPRILRDQVVDEVAICVPQDEWSRVDELAQLAHQEGKLIRIPLAVPELRSAERFVEELDGTAVMSYAHGPDELTAHAVKRLLDIGIAGVGLVLASPIMLAIAIVLRLAQGPGVLFRQERVGMHGRLFTIVKFRTMTVDAEERYPELAHRSYTQGPAFKLQDDPRVTTPGRWLRRYSLDELPQLWNVLRGEMSIVGPRPAPAREVEAYDLWHRRRLSMKPGITGLWQITSRLDQDFDQRAELDMDYIDRWSLRLDLAILFRTIPAVLRRQGH